VEVWDEYPIIGMRSVAVDDQSHLRLPDQFLRIGPRVVVAPLSRCIGIWPERSFARFAADVKANAERLVAMRFFARSADALVEEGLLQIPVALMRAAGLRRRGLVTGALDHVELWTVANWREAERQASAAQGADEFCLQRQEGSKP